MASLSNNAAPASTLVNVSSGATTFTNGYAVFAGTYGAEDTTVLANLTASNGIAAISICAWFYMTALQTAKAVIVGNGTCLAPCLPS